MRDKNMKNTETNWEAVRVAVLQDLTRIEDCKLYTYKEDGSIQFSSLAVKIVVDGVCRFFDIPVETDLPTPCDCISHCQLTDEKGWRCMVCGESCSKPASYWSSGIMWVSCPKPDSPMCHI